MLQINSQFFKNVSWGSPNWSAIDKLVAGNILQKIHEADCFSIDSIVVISVFWNYNKYTKV